jgi:hypothetical protein
MSPGYASEIIGRIWSLAGMNWRVMAEDYGEGDKLRESEALAVEFKSNKRCTADKSWIPDIMGEKENQLVWSIDTTLRASVSGCQYAG